MPLPPDPLLAALIRRYPRLFRGFAPRCYSWVEPGWHGLVDKLLRDVDALMTDEQLQDFEILQIKEKLGQLRLYFLMGDDLRTALYLKVDLLGEIAREVSGVTCQVCGARGRCGAVEGKISTLCDLHCR